MKKNNKPAQKNANKPSKNGSKKSGSDYLLPAIIIGITLIAYIPVLSAGFINWDDNQYVYENNLIKSFANLKDLIFTPLQGNYHPLTMLSLTFNYAVSHYDAWSYHLLNVLLHLANTFFVYQLATTLGKGNKIIAATTALIFALHPMHVESVAWVTERKDVLYAFFFLLGLKSYLVYLEKGIRKDYLMTIVWLFLSLISKPAAVVFPIVLIALDLFYERKIEFKTVLEKFPHFLLALIFGYLTFMAQKEVGSTETIASFTFQNRFFFGCYSFMMYIVKLIVPLGLTPFYPYPSTNISLPLEYYFAPVFLILVVVVCALTYKSNKMISFGFAFYFINILLIMQFFSVGRAIIAERYAYMPYVGLGLIAGWGLEKLSHKFTIKPNYLVITIGLLLGGLTFLQASYWKSGATLWDHAIDVKPCSRVIQNRAVLYRKEGNVDKALELYTRALTYHDDVIENAIFTNRGNIYFDKKMYAQAIDDYRHALNLKPDDYLGYENRGSSYLMLAKYDSAYLDLTQSITLKQDNPSAYYKRGIANMNGNHPDMAVGDFKKYLESKPGDAEVMNSVGMCYQRLKNYEEAINFFGSAIKMGNKGTYYLNRSYCYMSLGKKDLAAADALDAMKLGAPVSIEYATQLGLKK